MFDSISNFLSGADANANLDQFSNDNIINTITSPTGLGIYIAIAVLMVYMKQRILFLLMVCVMGGIFITRYTLTDTDGPNVTMFGFIGATVILAIYVIYTAFIREE